MQKFGFSLILESTILVIFLATWTDDSGKSTNFDYFCICYHYYPVKLGQTRELDNNGQSLQ